jgi:hypothetical protein
VVGTKPVIAIQIASTHTGNLIGTQMVRFDDRGDFDGTFAQDGSRYLSNTGLDNSRISWGAFAVDSRGRIVFATVRYSSYGTRLDLFRLSRTGSLDSTYDASTAPIVTPPDYDALVQGLMVTAGHYVLAWNAFPSSSIEYRATGFSDTDGVRWTALGVQGSARVEAPRFAPDVAKFYLVDDYYGATDDTAVYVSRRIVQ